MSPHPVTYSGLVWRTTEALFQALRFSDSEIREQIREQKSPMAAKLRAKKYVELMTVEQLSQADLDNMRACLRLKINQHPQLKQELLATGSTPIIEDCTRRQRGSGLFWGAALRGTEWVGENWLGGLWEELRGELSQLQLEGE